MKSTYLNMMKQITFFVAVCALTWAAASPPGGVSRALGSRDGAANSLENNVDAVNGGGHEAPADGLSVGPGRVTFQLNRSGRWLALAPDWAGGETAITGGGFIVWEADPTGTVRELANTASGGERLRARDEARNLRAVFEGIPGGVRFPLAGRDDDGDGREDEERLDGVDNDGDGRIDEDFAAAGDEMIALSYEALDDQGRPLFYFYQECYAWTLPHIDGMVAIKLVVRNTSDRSINDLFIGAVIRRPEGFAVSTQDLAPRNRGGERLASKGILLSEPERTSVACVFFAEPAAGESSWLTGVASAGRRLTDLVQAFVTAERGEGEWEPVEGNAGALEPPGAEPSTDRVAYGVSPGLGRLAPGEEAVVYAALVAVPSIERVDRSVEDAYRTVIGDGVHRMIPPPVSFKRKTVWGTYNFRYDNGDSPSGVTITLQNARGKGIGATDISYLTGIDLAQVQLREEFNGDVTLELDGDLYSDLAGTGIRAEICGRLKNGDLFDVVLAPEAGVERDTQIDGMSETQYWSRPGKLDDELLSGSPNPFRESTTIFYEVPGAVPDDDGGVLSFANPVQASVKIYNVAGRLVSVLVDNILSPGRYNTSWNGFDDNGSGVASGVYYVKLQIGKKHVTKRLIQLK